ncbi:host HNS inhibition protein [Pseudomonas phage vB_PpuP-Kallioja]
MSMTLKLNVSFPMTIVVKAETLKAFDETREEARKIPAEEIEKLKGETKFRAELFRGDRTTEQVMELIYRAGIRELIRKELVEEITGNESTARLGCIKVTYEAPPKRSCQGCIETNCVLAERNTNAGCDNKRTGVREPGPRWTETV